MLPVRTMPAGSLAGARFGRHDLMGNVWEGMEANRGWVGDGLLTTCVGFRRVRVLGPEDGGLAVR